MQTWQVGYDHGREEHFAELLRVPFWALAASRLVDAIDAAIGHAWCHNRVLSGCFNWAFFLDDRHAHSLYRFSVSAELAQVLGAESFDDED